MRECELTSKSGSHGTDHAEVGITCDSRQINVFTKAKMRSYCTADEQCNWLRYSIEHYLLVVAARRTSTYAGSIVLERDKITVRNFTLQFFALSTRSHITAPYIVAAPHRPHEGSRYCIRL